MNKTAAELQLRERVLEMEARLRDLDQGMARFRNLEEQRQILADELKQVRAYSNQLELVIKDRGMVRVHRIGPATPPAAPDRELQSFLTLPALFGPLLLGLILGYVRPRYQS